MSRGPGKIERAIEAAFADTPDDIFMVEDLVALAYPGVNRIEKKHRVAVLRAAAKVCGRTDWRQIYSSRPGGGSVFVNMRSLRSYGLGEVRVHADASGPQGHTTHDLRLMVDGLLESQWHSVSERVRGMQQGQKVWASWMMACARMDGRHEEADELFRQFKLLVYGRITEIQPPERFSAPAGEGTGTAPNASTAAP